MSYIWFWFSKFIVETMVGLAVLMVVGLMFLPGKLRQLKCKHEKYHENQACEAICLECCKNLGFIGRVRAERGRDGEVE